MYRKRGGLNARAAHKLQAPSSQPQQQPPGGAAAQQSGGIPGQPAQGGVPFFNPAQHQNGTASPPAGAHPGEKAPDWGAATSQQDMNANSVQNQGHLNNYQHNYQQEGAKEQDLYQAQEVQEAPLTLDPSGQWQWDYQGQQWMPYTAPQQGVEDITRGVQHLNTGGQEVQQQYQPQVQQQQYQPEVQQQYQPEVQQQYQPEVQQQYQPEVQQQYQPEVQQQYQPEVQQDLNQYQPDGQQNYQPEVQQQYQPEVLQQQYQPEVQQQQYQPGLQQQQYQPDLQQQHQPDLQQQQYQPEVQQYQPEVQDQPAGARPEEQNRYQLQPELQKPPQEEQSRGDQEQLRAQSQEQVYGAQVYGAQAYGEQVHGAQRQVHDAQGPVYGQVTLQPAASQPMMSPVQAFESFSQEEEVEAREAAPAPPHQSAPAPPHHPAPPPAAAQSPPQGPFSPAPPAGPGALPFDPSSLADPQPLIMFSPGAPLPPQQDERVDPPMYQPPSLGPPDLVDHGPPHPPLLPPSQGAQGGPDLTQPPQPSPSSHDDHYNWYSDQQGGGMPDVTGGAGGPPGKAPDILGAGGQGGHGGLGAGGHSVPTSDRNLYMETGQLEEDDEVVMVGGGREAPMSLPPMLGAGREAREGPASLPPMFGAAPVSLPPMVGADSLPPTFGAAPMSLPPMVGADSLPPMFGGSSSLPPMVGAPADSLPPTFGHSSSLPPPSLPPSQPLASPSLPPMVGGNEPPSRDQRMVVGSSLDTLPSAREPVEGQQAGDPAPRPPPVADNTVSRPPAPHSSLVSRPLSPHSPSATALPAVVEARSEAAGSEHRTAEMMAVAPPRPAPLPTPGRDIAGEESGGGGGGGYRRGSREPWDSEEERDSEEEDRMRRRRGGARRTVSPGSRSDRNRPARIQDRSYRSSTDRDAEEELGRRRGEDRRRRGGRDGSPVSRRSHNESYYDRKERERREEEEERRRRREAEDRRRRGDDERSVGGGRRVKQEFPEDDRASFYGSRPHSRAGSISGATQDTSYTRGYGGHSVAGGDPYARMMAEQYAAYQKQQWLMSNPQAYQAEVQRVQLQQAVHKMEMALEDPVKGGENVMTYKQYWDQYSGQMEKLRTENPMMHHLLQHFRSNWWHLVPLKLEPQGGEERPVSATPSTSLAFGGGDSSTTYGPPPASDSFRSDFGPELSNILEREERDRASVEQQEPVVGRLTPLMFSRPHPCARISASGLVVVVEASAPREGQSATVQLHSLSSLLQHTAEHQELAAFPGPLKPGVTHKNDVIKFCERKISGSRGRSDLADRESFVLLWEMLILLLRQKGQVEGSDLAELLLRDSQDSSDNTHLSLHRSRASSQRGDRQEDTSSASSLVEVELVERSSQASTGEDAVARFRDYLLHGNKTEGLEFAMRAGLWGHALFLASKMDQRTYAGVMTRFANGLAITDPLQTLYQLMSSRMPSAMKQCADQRWGDWRPHLAMILSNPLPGSDINRRSMITLGDSLLAKGQLFAAQFCYIVSAAEWGTFGRRSSKLVLLCSQVGELSLQRFATTEAVQCTEVWEFVQRLGDPAFSMPTLQPYKYMHAVRLVEAGLATVAQDYIHELGDWISARVESGSSSVEEDPVPGWVQHTQLLAQRLKYLDPVYTTSAGELQDIPDPSWLGRLDSAVTRLQSYGGQEAGGQGQATQEVQEYPGYRWDQTLGWVVEQEGQENGYTYPDLTEPQEQSEQEHWQGQEAQEQWQGQEVQEHWQEQQQEASTEQLREPYQDQQVSYGQQPSPAPEEQRQGEQELEEPPSPSHAPAAPLLGFNPSLLPPALTASPQYDPGAQGPMFDPAQLPPIPERRTSVTEQAARPKMHRQGSIGRSRTTSSSEPQAPPNFFTPSVAPPAIAPLPPAPAPASAPAAGQEAKEPKKEAKKPPVQGKKGSFLGSLVPGLPSWLKPKNQVHLPDDSKPTIVFNESSGRWENTVEGEEDSCAPAAPPPMMAAAPSTGGPSLGGAPPPVNYRAGLTTRRGRGGYVDVLSQSGMAKPMTMTPSALTNGAPPGPGPALLDPSLPPSPQGGPTSLDYGGASSAPPPMMMFDPSSMGGGGAPAY